MRCLVIIKSSQVYKDIDNLKKEKQKVIEIGPPDIGILRYRVLK